jgi:hypothetical protein
MRYIMNNKGFTLVSALMTLTLLVALSTVVFVVSTKDLRIVTRSIGEKKAFSAVEAGTHQFMKCQSQAGGVPTSCDTTMDVAIDGGIDPNTKYSIGASTITGLPHAIANPGYEIGGSSGKSWGDSVTARTVTGKNTVYNSEVQVDVGIGYGPVEISTSQPAAGG